MARVKRHSRRFLLGTAFIGVMAGSGALFGGIGGALLMLLINGVLGLAASLLVVLPTSMVVGTVIAGALGIRLIARPAPAAAPATVRAWQPPVKAGIGISAASESN